MLGGAIGTTSWILNWFTEDGTRAVLGLSERGWRRTLDPALLFFMVGLLGLNARRDGRGGKLGKLGFVISLVGLAAILAGNVTEFWIGELLYVDVPGEFEPTDQLGWGIMGAGFMILLVGFILFGIATFRTNVLSGWKRVVPLIAWILMAMAFPFGLGWMVLGYALWSERADLPSHSAATNR